MPRGTIVGLIKTRAPKMYSKIIYFGMEFSFLPTVLKFENLGRFF
jgi:hypothetical protein